MFVVNLVVVLVLAIATILPLFRLDHWSVRGFDFPRLQIVALLTAACLLLAGTADFHQGTSWVLLGIAIACLIYQAHWVLPYTRLFPKEVKTTKRHFEGPCLRIITANVLTPNREYQKLIDVVRAQDPHVLVALETDSKWEAALDALITDGYEHTIRCPLDNLYGMHVYSKLPLYDAEIKFLVEDDKPSMHCFVELAPNTRVRLHFLHPAPPSPTENAFSTERDAELLVLARALQEATLPTIVTGDLNDVAWSTTTRAFRKVSGFLDPRVGRGMFNTFHAQHWFLRWPLDHLFHTDHFTLTHIRRLPDIGSDHFPLFTELSLHKDHCQGQKPLEDDLEAEELAREKDDEVRVKPSDVPTPGE